MNVTSTGANKNRSADGIFKSCVVAGDSAVVSSVGNQVLEQNGTIVDAAISSLLCNSLLNTQSMGIGGGFFMLHYSKKDEKITVIDARSTAPASSTCDMLRSHDEGGLSIGTPSEIKGYWLAHQMFGGLEWSSLFKPAIELCNNGYQLPLIQYEYMVLKEKMIRNTYGLRELFVNKINNELFVENSIMKRPKLAKTFEIIAKDGESAFYNGRLTDTIVNEIQSNGGIVTKQDLQNYECVVREPTTITLRNGIQVNSAPNPSSGDIINFILGVMDRYDHDKSDTVDANSLFYHRFVEAAKFGFGLRSMVGDDDFCYSKDVYNILKSHDILDEYKEKISDSHVYPTSYYGSKDFVEDNGTAHISLVGANGDAVSVTSSVNAIFGSKVVGEKTGIFYNSAMADFATPDLERSYSPDFPINYIQPGKRPASSMSPTIAINPDKSVRLVTGASGGLFILSAVALSAASNLIMDEDISKSVDKPRVHHQLSPDFLRYEKELDPEIRNDLASKGNNLKECNARFSSVQAISRLDDGRLHAVCDKKKGGIPFGF